jgi:hypothetical protein
VAAQITDKEGTRSLTEVDYKGLDLSRYSWAIDGYADPPRFHRGKKSDTFGSRDVFNAFARMMHALGREFSAWRRPGHRETHGDLGLLEAAGPDSAIRRMYDARKKIEPSQPRGGGSFRSGGDQGGKHFSFVPGPGVNWCLVERADPSDTHQRTAPLPQPSLKLPTLFELGVLARITAAPRGEAPARVEPLKLKLTLKTTPAVVDGVSVQINSLHVLGRKVRAHVTITNTTAKSKLIGYFTLHVGGQVLRARSEEPNRRRPHRRVRQLQPERFLLDRQVKGVLVFARPRIGGEAEVRARAIVG